jgi:hypothetical protein
MLKTAAKVFGIIFVIIGILGFIPGITSEGHLLGIFHVNTLHDMIHLASGIIAIGAGMSGTKASRMYFQIFGVVYGLVTVLGFIAGNGEILGVIANNLADNLLHVLISGSALYLGFGTRTEA